MIKHMNEDVKKAITSRRSVRKFLSTEISKDVIEDILTVSARAPSGTNIQPWNVHVLLGESKSKVCKASCDAFYDPKIEKKNERIHYMEDFREPYLARRRKVGWDLYALLNIKKGDYEKTKSFHVQNFNFFNAPVGLIFTIEKDLGWMSWLDYGMFIQNICIAARAYGLDTCPQAAWGQMHKVISPILNIEDGHIIHCGMSLGYEDKNADVNKLKTVREDLNTFTQFHE